MNGITTVLKRELIGYFTTPVAYVFTIIFLMLSSAFTFYLGGFVDRGQADLQPFFDYHPWLYLFMVPAVAMRLWAEERKTGTLELLLTLPITLWQAVLGKFFAGWFFLGIVLVLTFPIWITVNYLGSPDNGVIVASYLGSWLLAGAYLAVGSCLSASTQNQVIAFIATVTVCFLLTVSGFPIVLDWLRGLLDNVAIHDAVSSLSYLAHFDDISRGVLSFGDLIFFIISIVAWLCATVVVIEMKKG